MTTSIGREYRFAAAHSLPRVPDGHKCKRMHGHNYRIVVTLLGRVVSGERGWLIDFFDLDSLVGPLVEQLDHRTLNDIPGLENPTAELIARWFMDRIVLPSNINAWLASVRVYEEDDCWAEVSR